MVAGFDPLRDPLEVKRRVGYLPDQIGFYDSLSARDNLAYTGAARRPPAARDRRALRRRARRASGLADVGNAPGQHLFARHAAAARPRRNPDEAAERRDPRRADHRARPAFDAGIPRHDPRRSKADGTAVLLSSHHLDQVQSVCDRVALFNRGRIALSGTVTELAAPGARRRPCHRCRGERRRCRRERLAAIPGVVRVQPLGGPTATASIASATCAPRSPARLGAGGRADRHRISPRRASTRSTTAISRRLRHAADVSGRAARRGPGSARSSPRRPPTICRSARMRILEALVFLDRASAPPMPRSATIRATIGESPFLFLRLLTLAQDPLPSFIGLLGFLIPLVAIALGFDSVNGEFNRRTMSRILAQPIYRDALLLGKFLAGLLVARDRRWSRCGCWCSGSACCCSACRRAARSAARCWASSSRRSPMAACGWRWRCCSR